MCQNTTIIISECKESAERNQKMRTKIKFSYVFLHFQWGFVSVVVVGFLFHCVIQRHEWNKKENGIYHLIHDINTSLCAKEEKSEVKTLKGVRAIHVNALKWFQCYYVQWGKKSIRIYVVKKSHTHKISMNALY